MKTLTGSLFAASLLMLSSPTFAAEPVQLTAAEMDGVTAGLISSAYANALAFGAHHATFELTISGGVLTLSVAVSASSSH